MPLKGERDPIKERYWRGVLADWQASGMFAKEYCIKHNVHYNNFIAWKKRLPLRDAELDADGRPLETACFAPVRVIESQPRTEVTAGAKDVAIELVLRNGIVLRLSGDCPLKLLSDVISLLGVD
jgi:hypothetical protein